MNTHVVVNYQDFDTLHKRITQAKDRLVRRLQDETITNETMKAIFQSQINILTCLERITDDVFRSSITLSFEHISLIYQDIDG